MKQQSTHIRNFTLVEIMVALAVLLLMMVFLLSFANGARRIFTETNRQNTLFHDAQAATTLLENDLKNMVCSYEPGKIMQFYMDTPNDTTILGFYTVQPKPQNNTTPEAQTRLFPVIYLHEEKTHKLYRFLWIPKIGDKESEDGNETPWDDIGNESIHDPNFKNVFLSMRQQLNGMNASDRLNCEVLNNVSQITISALYPNETDGEPNPIPQGTHEYRPTILRIALDLYSRNAISEMRWNQMKKNGSLNHEIDKTRRRFSKTIRLPNTSDEVITE